MKRALALALLIGCSGGSKDDADDTGGSPSNPYTSSSSSSSSSTTNVDVRIAAINQLAPDLNNGAQVFTDNCATCHGPFGDGGSSGPPLRYTGLSRTSIAYQVLLGSEPAMPSFSSLPDQELADLFLYVEGITEEYSSSGCRKSTSTTPTTPTTETGGSGGSYGGSGTWFPTADTGTYYTDYTYYDYYSGYSSTGC